MANKRKMQIALDHAKKRVQTPHAHTQLSAVHKIDNSVDRLTNVLSLISTKCHMRDEYLGELQKVAAKRCRHGGVPVALQWASWMGVKHIFDASIVAIDNIGADSNLVVDRISVTKDLWTIAVSTSHRRRHTYLLDLEMTLDLYTTLPVYHGLIHTCISRSHLDLVRIFLEKASAVISLRAVVKSDSENLVKLLLDLGEHEAQWGNRGFFLTAKGMRQLLEQS
ncbi:hypothetical protein BKA67DRAFT_541043 [Truncatella angustata]|uniref:Uncharacterized protein n=1 Tax=Truncatella angustata TaxID=152316 RepID=A0A9P8UBH0_9PEZI|nr:uncharacterized protein BKA67DRAFT_541043 [Truncatella angustata]KAH6646052.1 hypothetical protein BKA67DRAFT_541043 [Truncatella angustata]